jgi:hypothetical protein
VNHFICSVCRIYAAAHDSACLQKLAGTSMEDVDFAQAERSDSAIAGPTIREFPVERRRADADLGSDGLPCALPGQAPAFSVESRIETSVSSLPCRAAPTASARKPESVFGKHDA